MLVEDIMTRPPITCMADDTAFEAARLMWDHDIGALPVVEPDGRLVGMITDRDLCMAAFLSAAPLASIEVHEAMARDVFACAPIDPVTAAERLMGQRQIRRLPVVDPLGRVLGVVSLHDLAREAERGGGRRRPDVPDVDISRTLAAIGRPRSLDDVTAIVASPPPRPGSGRGSGVRSH